MKRNLLAVLVTASMTLLASNASAAATPAPARQSTQQARVGGDVIVPLANSRLSAAQLAAMRPGYESLRPKAR